MPRDIDHIIERLNAELPGVQITQLQVSHPADDDGLWVIRIPDRDEAIQIESSSGYCPFLVESHFNDERVEAQSVDQVVRTVKKLFA